MQPAPEPEIENRLAEVRKQRGVAASALAERVGISRQAVYAVEAGTYIPNTAVALRLAQALGVSMEQLFSLPQASVQLETATLLPESAELQPGQTVQLCQVNGKWMAAAPTPSSCYLPATDGSISSPFIVRGKAKVQLNDRDADFGNRLLLAGCDPAMSIVARHLQTAGLELVLLHQNSSQSLALLKSGCTHLAGSHLKDDSAITRMFPRKSAAVVSFALWQEGLVTAHGNPKSIGNMQDLARKDITFLNREAGSGSRALLDRYLKLQNLNPVAIAGYQRTAPGHLPAAWEVKAGAADCCIATQAAARFFGLHFIPLETVRYDLVLRKQDLDSPKVQLLLNGICQLSFRRKLNGIGGYDTSVTGTRVQ
jgi:putative molybdopterin biosynthesis protein